MVLGRVRRQATETSLVTAIVNELNLAQQTICEKGPIKPWFLLTVADVTIDATGFKAPIPTGLLELYEAAPAVWYVSDTGALKPLEKAGRNSVEWPLKSPNTLSAYAVDADYIQLASALTVGNSLRVLYFKAEDLPTGAYGSAGQPSPNKWYANAPDVMIAEAGSVICRSYLRDEKGAAALDAQATKAWNRILAETTAREEAARERFMNGDLFPLAGSVRS